MHTKTLAPGVALALLAAGCGAQYAKPIPQVAEPPPSPINLADRSPVLTNLSSLTYDIPMGTSLGQMGVEGNSKLNHCTNLEPLTYKAGTKKSDSAAFDSVFRDVMGSIGVPVEQAVQRFEGEEIKKADLQVAATIKDMSLNICYPRVWNDKSFAIGAAQLTIDWAVFSPLERKVVYTAVTKGTAPQLETNLGEMGVLREAFRDALLLLAAKPEFADTMARKAAAGPRSETLALIQPPASTAELRRNLEAIRRAVVTVRSTAGEGSGFAIGDGTYVVTAAHVVGGTTQVKMFTASDEELYGDVVRTDLGRDVALIKLTEGRLKPLHVSQSGARAGEDTYAIGSPLGRKFVFSVTRGVVSGFPRINNRAYIQSDVNVLPGSSGGPLIDGNGNVIGVAALSAAFADVPVGMNFFVPAGELLESLSLTLSDKK